MKTIRCTEKTKDKIKQIKQDLLLQQEKTNITENDVIMYLIDYYEKSEIIQGNITPEILQIKDIIDRLVDEEMRDE